MKYILGKILIILTLSIFLNANSSLTLNLSKKDVYVGEAIKATLTLKYDLASPIIKTDFDEFLASNFWIKDLDESDPIKDKDFTYIHYTFKISPQISGNLTIDPQLLRVAIREAKTNLIIWSDLYSKAKNIDVSTLPKNIDIHGNYTIEAITNQTEVDANKPLNLTIKIKGVGNFDDMKPFKLEFKNLLNFSTKPLIKANFKDGQYQGEFIQKFSIIADKDFMLPPISFKYFNSDTKLIETIQTKSIKIKVKNQKPAFDKEDKYTKYIFGLFGFILAIIFILILNHFKNKKEYLPIDVKIKRCKNDKQLYKLLLPFSQQTELSITMKKLEENIYNNGKNKIDKSVIIGSISTNKCQ